MTKYIAAISLALLSCSKKEEIREVNIDEVNIDEVNIEAPAIENTCQIEIDKILSENNNTGFIDNRLELLIRAKGEPILFEREPKTSEDDINSPFYKSINSVGDEWRKLSSLLPVFKTNPKAARRALLKEGYLYNENVAMAGYLVEYLKLTHLFNEKFIWVHRGNHIMKAENKGTYYMFVDGPLKNNRADILLFDRISLKEPKDSLHIDLKSIKDLYNPDNISIIDIKKDYIIAKLDDVDFLFNRYGSNLEFNCSNKEYNKKPNYGLGKLKKSIMIMVDEKLPFDEPKTEYGQQDGLLRETWLSAYNRKRDKYYVNGDIYKTFNPGGFPRVPQVCVDFLVDTLDISCNTWYNSQIKSSSFKTSDYNMRSISDFTRFAKDNPEWFDVFEFKDKIEIGSLNFHKNTSHYDLREGDMVFITGKVPWDKREMHSHSFFIFQTDPLTNYPVLLAGNAGPAALRSWGFETRRTPRRYINKVIRIKPGLFDKFTKDAEISSQIIR
jgi:hypothetical protein